MARINLKKGFRMSEQKPIKKLEIPGFAVYTVGKNCDEILDKSAEWEDSIYCAYEIRKNGEKIHWIENIGVILNY